MNSTFTYQPASDMRALLGSRARGTDAPIGWNGGRDDADQQGYRHAGFERTGRS